jgi:hypothetical protein
MTTLERGVRQLNGHDCGVFVAADIASLAETGALQSFTQQEILNFRKVMSDNFEQLDEWPANEKDPKSFDGQTFIELN